MDDDGHQEHNPNPNPRRYVTKPTEMIRKSRPLRFALSKKLKAESRASRWKKDKLDVFAAAKYITKHGWSTELS